MEEENEMRRLEDIYKVSGKDKKTHVSMTEVYGFVSWNISALAFIVYLIWAFVPDKYLKEFGISYIPDKHYAIALPWFFIFSFGTILVMYVAVCIHGTPNMESYETL